MILIISPEQLREEAKQASDKGISTFEASTWSDDSPQAALIYAQAKVWVAAADSLRQAAMYMEEAQNLEKESNELRTT